MTTLDRFTSWTKTSLTLKLAIIGFIILLLMIPTFLVDELISDRRRLRDSAQDEVAAKFGGEQTVGGPVISVPYKYSIESTNAAGQPVSTPYTGYAHFLPDAIDVKGELVPEQRKRGIFVAVLYNTQFRVSGKFSGFNAAALGIPEDALQWEDAIFTVGISDMTGVDAEIDLQLADDTYSLGPGTITKDIFPSGANTPITVTGEEEELAFDFALNLNGSSGLYFRPFGVKTSVEITSAWPDPSFAGTYLPQTSEVTADGFVATWEVLQLNRNYPQQGTGAYTPRFNVNSRYDYGIDGANTSYGEDRFGVRLLLPVDEYSKIYRSTNYALLFIIITFLTFFFIEVLNRKRVHPIQYILIGAAVILFYVLLLSISEHQHFALAYWISAAAITLLITGYSYAVLRNFKLTGLVAGLLIVLYVFFYSLLQLQDFALLVGSLGLLLILAVIMYLTRNVDWYNLGGAKKLEE
ncbi:cell envelope integrity protein CreD [Lewinella sp. 4G2]|uniref:cell envelope integrity protein CreD n=1 Tax=Lewinella sp. 4G2 TaxID=1803372 RepID=UPI0007B4AE37|nr:cell envelope integrity protein CreD [Lewinella sp. 4G2]OAV44089.1 hypothetical protein A3850_006065 [Lewinella sp. 4G2]